MYTKKVKRRQVHGRRERNLADTNGKISAAGDGDRGEGRLRNHTTCRRVGGGDRRCHSRDARPLGGTRTGVILGFFPH